MAETPAAGASHEQSPIYGSPIDWLHAPGSSGERKRETLQ